jgi:hypothetical protein
LRAQRWSRFDVADDDGGDFIEGAAVELEKLLDREAIGITGMSCNSGTSLLCSLSRDSRCLHWTAESMRPHLAWRVAPMYWPTRPAVNPRSLSLPRSEVVLAINAHEKLIGECVRSRVVSMPSWEIFEHQALDYQDNVLPPRVTARLAVEQASTFGWEPYIGDSRRVIGMKTFGASAPLKELQRKFEPDRIVALAKEILGRA